MTEKEENFKVNTVFLLAKGFGCWKLTGNRTTMSKKPPTQGEEEYHKGKQNIMERGRN